MLGTDTLVCATVFYVFACSATATPVVKVLDSEAIILHSSSVSNPQKGSYAYSFDTSNGIRVEESGVQKRFRHEDSSEEQFGTVSKGRYSFTFPDDTIMTVNWVADENGYQPKITYSTPIIHLPEPNDDLEVTTTINTPF